MTTVFLLALVAAAAQLSALSTGSVSALVTFAAQGPVQDLKAAYEKSGPVDVTFETSPNITKRLAAGEMPDVLVAQASTIDDMVKGGRAVNATRKRLGTIGVGVAMGKGSQRPDVSSEGALKASILKADSVVYSRGASGLLVEDMLKKLGVADQVKAKIVQVGTGADVMQRMGEDGHGNQIGFTMVSEIRLGESHGGKLVAPLPAAVQTYTTYEAVVMTSAKDQNAAKAFIAAITTPVAHKVFAAAGWN